MVHGRARARDFDGPVRQPADGHRRRQPLPGEHRAATSDPSHRGFRVPGHLDAQGLPAQRLPRRRRFEQAAELRAGRRPRQPPAVAGGAPQRRHGDQPRRRRRAADAADDPQRTVLERHRRLRRRPTFRVRAELKKDKVDLSPPGLAENVFTCRGEGYGIEIPAFLTVCLIVPTKTRGALARRRAEHGPALQRHDDDGEPGAHGRRGGRPVRRLQRRRPARLLDGQRRRRRCRQGRRRARSCRRPACAWTTSRSGSRSASGSSACSAAR